MLAFAAEFDRRLNRIGTPKSPRLSEIISEVEVRDVNVAVSSRALC
jgi:hypothetical protein